MIALAPCLTAQQPTGGFEGSTWLNYFGDHPVTDSVAIHLEGQFRRTFLSGQWEQILLRPGITYDYGHGFTSLFAYTYLLNYPVAGGGKEPEHRALEELEYEHQVTRGGEEKGVTFAHRFRAEQRWQTGDTDWEFGERARYRLTVHVPFRWNTEGSRPDYASFYDEVFVRFGPHGGDHALDQNRAYGAVGWKLNRYNRLEIGYLHRYNPQPTGTIGVNDHSLQISLFSIAPLRRGLKKKK